MNSDMNIIMRCWLGSPVGVSLFCSSMLPDMISARGRIGSASGENARVSGNERSATHRKPAWRSSIALRNVLYSAKKTGICTSIGRQPPNCDTLFSLNSSCCFRYIFCGSSLYCSRSAFNCGWSSCILRMDWVLLWLSGKKTTLTAMVMTMIAQP